MGGGPRKPFQNLIIRNVPCRKPEVVGLFCKQLSPNVVCLSSNGAMPSYPTQHSRACITCISKITTLVVKAKIVELGINVSSDSYKQSVTDST